MSREYRLKAAFLFHFISYIEWPPKAFSDPKDPIVIGVLGSDPFGKELEKTLTRRPVKNRPVQVQRFGAWKALANPSRLRECHVLFVAADESANTAPILKSLGDAPLLVVSDDVAACARGVAIGFFLEKNKVRFQIERAALAKAKLSASSQLLRLGRRPEGR